MFCPSCGSNLEEDVRFCANCGCSIESEQQDLQGKSKNLFKETKNLKKIIAVVVAIAIVIGIFSLVGNLSSGTSGASKTIAYVKDGKLYYKENMKSKKEAFEVTKLRSDSSYYWCEFSEDGKYLYFISKVTSSGTGDLNCIEVKKIKANSDKNKDAIKKIASNVSAYNIKLVGGKGVLYTKSGKLEYFNGKEDEVLVKNCSQFSYNEEENVVVYTVQKDEGYSLYAGKLSSKMEAKEIDDKINYVISMENPEFLVYYKQDDEWNKELYVANMQNDPEKISKKYDNISIDAEKKCLIFTEGMDTESVLYDFVEDDYAEQDAGVVEPEKKDYLVEVELKDVLSESDYTYYTEHPEYLDNFYKYLYQDDSTGMKRYSRYKDGSYQYYYYDGAKWYQLDETLYGNAVEEFEKKEDRIKLRERLKEEEYNQNLQKAYYYTFGKDAELLVEGVNNIRIGDVEAKLLTYKRTNYEKPMLSQVESVWDLQGYLSENAEHTAYINVGKGKETELEAGDLSAVQVSEDKSKCAIWSYGKNNDGDYEYELVMYNIKKNEAKMESTLTDNESNPVGLWIGNSFYYFSNTDDEEVVLNLYENGKSKQALEDVEYAVQIYKDEVYVVFDGKGEVELYGKNQKQIESFDDIDNLYYLDKKCILLIQEEDLYLYDGSDDLKEIDDNVEYLTVPTWEGAEGFLYNEYYN